MKRIARLFCSIILLFAVVVSASGVVHASGAHESHMAAMSVGVTTADPNHDHGDHASHDMHDPSGDHDGPHTPDLMSCCAAMTGACAGFMAFLPTASLWEPSTNSVPSYPVSQAYLSGIEPECAFRPPRA